MELTTKITPSIDCRYYDRAHHPFLLGYIPEEAIERRKLTRVSLGMEGRSVKPYLPLYFHTKPVPGGFKLRFEEMYFSVSKKEEAFELSCRIYRLVINGYFQKLSETFEHEGPVVFALRNLGSRKVVVFRGTYNGDLLPSDWLEESAFDEITNILERIEGGDFCLKIDDGHPGKDAILSGFKEMAGTPCGREVLFRLDATVKKTVRILYKAKEFYFCPSLSTMVIDHARSRRCFTLEKASGKVFFFEATLASVIVHECLHVLTNVHRYTHYGVQGFFTPSELVKRATYDETQMCYVSDVGPFHTDFTNLEEQFVILGVNVRKNGRIIDGWSISENRFHYEQGEGPLRYGHRTFQPTELSAPKFEIPSEEVLVGVKDKFSTLELALTRGEASPIKHLLEKEDSDYISIELMRILSSRFSDIHDLSVLNYFVEEAIKKKVFSGDRLVHVIKPILKESRRRKSPQLVDLVERLLLLEIEKEPLIDTSRLIVQDLLGEVVPWRCVDTTHERIKRITGLTAKRPKSDSSMDRYPKRAKKRAT